MFDIEIGKVAMIGTVALVVLGPERLPRVARTVGTLLGRAQNYMKNVRAEVEQQIHIDELRKLKDGIEHEVAELQGAVESSVRQQAAQVRAEIDAAAAELRQALPDSYLPSMHEAGGAWQDDFFSARPAQAGGHERAWRGGAAHTAGPAGGTAVAPAATPSVPQPARTRWHAAALGGRPAAARRSRVVSVAASKSLRRSTGTRM